VGGLNRTITQFLIYLLKFSRSYIGTRRAKNIGWRLDYFVISERLLEKVVECEIHSDITGSAHGSDHCPLSLIIDI